MTTRLVLFDIDGTLLTTNGHAVKAMLASAEAAYGVKAAWDTSTMNGKTELWIVHKLLGDAGLTREEIGPRLPGFWKRYVEELKGRLTPGNVTVFAGVREVLRLLAGREDLLVGLLTGNIEASAQVKLETAALDGFALGAFGEHHEDRSALPTLAVEAAARLRGESISGGEIIIVGDTPHDITCGKHLGVNTIAVATGKFGMEELQSHNPTHVFHDLSDTQAVLNAIDMH